MEDSIQFVLEKDIKRSPDNKPSGRIRKGKLKVQNNICLHQRGSSLFLQVLFFFFLFSFYEQPPNRKKINFIFYKKQKYVSKVQSTGLIIILFNKLQSFIFALFYLFFFFSQIIFKKARLVLGTISSSPVIKKSVTFLEVIFSLFLVSRILFTFPSVAIHVRIEKY